MMDDSTAARERRPGFWTLLEQRAMDARFCEAMQAAGYTLTSPSTHAGTRAPILGYQRRD
jgi:hypothetical protein